jgi:hypothetical protein
LIGFFIFSIIGSSWITAVKELLEHYAQREASCPVLKQVVLENLRKIKNEKIDEYNKVEKFFFTSYSFILFMANRFYSMMKKL